MNNIGWGKGVDNNTIGFGGVTTAIERVTTTGDVRITEDGDIRVTENSGLESWGAIYSRTFTGETDIIHEG
jgi:hypothetical protein